MSFSQSGVLVDRFHRIVPQLSQLSRAPGPYGEEWLRISRNVVYD